eukprot:5473456-Amphidinium_carterae.1
MEPLPKVSLFLGHLFFSQLRAFYQTVELDGRIVTYGQCRGWFVIPPSPATFYHHEMLFDLPDKSVIDVTASPGCQLIGSQGMLHEFSDGVNGGIVSDQPVCLYGQRWHDQPNYAYSLLDEEPCSSDDVVAYSACFNSRIVGDATACLPLGYWLQPWSPESITNIALAALMHGAAGLV